MDCPSCGQSNREGARFCDACGQALTQEKPEAPTDLARKIAASRTALEGERKQVTVLFADVMGSMELAERTIPSPGGG